MKTAKSCSKILILCALVLALSLAGGAAMAEVGKYRGNNPKYVFFFIGDGMGIPQRSAAEMYKGERLLMDTFPAQGITTTFAANRFITGSAASATALASGQKTNINFIGMAPNKTPVKTLAELSKDSGRKVGIVSSVSIDHATPAAFYAHVPHRGMYHEIDCALAESGFDFFGGGGLKDPGGKKSESPKGDALAIAKNNGYKVVTEKAEFMKLGPEDGKIIAFNAWLQDGKALPYEMDRRSRDISLPEFTEKAIQMLDNKNGFFLMVEGGKIDWACHANDGAAAIINTLAFDDSIKKAVEFAKKHPQETLIVVTGDHECGGLTLGFAGTKYSTDFELLKAQKVSFQKFTDDIVKNFKKANKSNCSFEAFKPVITRNFGLKFKGDANKDAMVLKPHEHKQLAEAFKAAMADAKLKSKDPQTYLLYGGYDPLAMQLTHILNNKAGLAWTSYKHTGVPVSTSAMGVGAEMFNGYYDNTEVAKKIMAVMGMEPKVYKISEAASCLKMAVAN